MGHASLTEGSRESRYERQREGARENEREEARERERGGSMRERFTKRQ